MKSLLLSVAVVIPANGLADVVLVDDGVSVAPIVIYEDAPPLTREAAGSLADYIEKASGARPRVIEGRPDPLPAHAIWVGWQPVLEELFPDTSLAFSQPEEILIAANANHVVIAGRDRWDPDRTTALVGDRKMKRTQIEYGTANAIYTFLQDRLGVRWFWPGELGEDVKPLSTVAFEPFTYRHRPQVRSRGGVFRFSALGGKSYGGAQDWTRFQRLQLDSLQMSGGHAFTDWWARYSDKHPDIFALQPDGTRSAFPNPKSAKLCVSNPKVRDLWLEDVADQLEQNPNLTIFNASPNDSWASGHCVCDRCRAWDHSDGEPRVFNWRNHKETRPALSDRDVTFANKLGAALEAKYPGRGYRVLMMSYGNSGPAPVEARPTDNVIMSIVANFFGRTGFVDRGSMRGETYREQFEAWAEIVPSMLWRPNTGSPAGWSQGLPDLSIQQTTRDIKDVAAANGEGIFIDSVWEHWATQGPQYYVMAQLVWNPDADAEAILADYYVRAFGTAADEVREYFDTLEDERMKFVARNGEVGLFGFDSLYTKELLAASQARLDRAAKAVPPDSLFAKRVAFVQAGLSWTDLVVENIRLMEGYWDNPASKVAKQVKENWQAMEELVAAHPYAINWAPVRPNTSRMSALHPDGSPPKKRRRANDRDLD